MSKVRINDLARELEVKSREILDALTHVGVTEKKTHSSSLEADEAERVRQHFHRSGKNGAGAARRRDIEPKQKIDWSRVSKPGDVLKAIQQRKDEAAAIAQRTPAPPVPPQAAKPSIPARPAASPGGRPSRVTGCVSSGPEYPAGRRCLGSSCSPHTLPPVKLRLARVCRVRPGPPRCPDPADSNPAAARAATDCSPAPAGAPDRGDSARDCGQATRRARCR